MYIAIGILGLVGTVAALYVLFKLAWYAICWLNLDEDK